ncbi:hypothetical protein B9Z19DRAFT_1087935 [Tuber borchii]|uniref:Protein kinase domain-containing protein n=1 Tax=Tuber borchii TaxID=42251 RepID=A0A2T6ZM87_TUBBO|nr:hypothetical protein B9Z19DRAFT_1087935 [Tuber borchii]
MAVVGLTFRALSTLDICLRVGPVLRERYEDVQDTSRDLVDLNIRVENVWIRIEYQLNGVLRSEEEVPQVLCDHREGLLDQLLVLLHTAFKNIDKATEKNGKRKVLKFVLFTKGSLDKDVSALEKWRDTFGSTLHMPSIPRTPRFSRRVMEAKPRSDTSPIGSAIVDANEPTEQLPSFWLDSFRMYSLDPIGYSGAHIVFDDNTHTKYIMETIIVDQGLRDYSELDQEVEFLAEVLGEPKDLPGILTCKGVVRKVGTDGQLEEFQFILEMPHGLGDTPSCLRSVLHRSTHEPPPREDRVLLARQIANAVISVNNLYFIHGDMRPETVLIFPNPGSTLGVPFLVGLMFRSAVGISFRAGDYSWSKSLYRHPSSQGTHPNNIYRMQYDIYSLGVILLEIGLWSPFVDHNGQPGVALSQIVPILKDGDQSQGNAQIKKIFITMAQSDLPQIMGAKYADMVVACLTCLDRESELGSEIEFPEDDGILVGVRYVQRILRVLEEIEG